MICVLRNFACAALCTVALVGCGGGERPFTDNSKDSAAFAKDVKQVILNAAEELKTSKQPGDTVRAIVQTLSDLDQCPTGEHLQTYKDMHAIASDLLTKSENGRPSDMNAKLAEITKLANTLPGEVTIVKETGTDR